MEPTTNMQVIREGLEKSLPPAQAAIAVKIVTDAVARVVKVPENIGPPPGSPQRTAVYPD